MENYVQAKAAVTIETSRDDSVKVRRTLNKGSGIALVIEIQFYKIIDPPNICTTASFSSLGTT